MIHPTIINSALSELRPISELILEPIKSVASDPLVLDQIGSAWSPGTLQKLGNHPSLVEASALTPSELPEAPVELRRPNALKTYTFKVTYLRQPEVRRTIEIEESGKLDDLHRAIIDSVDFDFDHLYSFFLNNRAWDKDTEYAPSGAGEGHNSTRVMIGNLNLRMKQRFLYIYDYGDEHRFEIQLIQINPEAPKVEYPRILEEHGENPPQYDNWD